MWAPLEVQPGGGWLKLEVAGGCRQERNKRAVVVEGRSRVTVRVTVEEAIYGPPGIYWGCFLRNPSEEWVELQRPLDGRELLGQSSSFEGKRKLCEEEPANLAHCEAVPVAVPNVVGFSLRDAREALRLAGLRARVQRRPAATHRVIAQSPFPEQAVHWESPVRLRVAGA